MNFLFMVGDEYHDNYRDSFTVEAKSSTEVLEDSDYEYYMQGYLYCRPLHGPVFEYQQINVEPTTSLAHFFNSQE